MKPQQFRKLKEIKIRVLYLIVSVIHFQQGKDFPPFFFFILLPASLLHFSLSLTLSFVSLRYLLSLCLCLCLCICLFVSISVSVSPSLCLPCMSLSLSFLNSIKRSYQSHRSGHVYDMAGRDWLILCNL